jgi:uncharacterized protein (TIGR02996 family)
MCRIVDRFRPGAALAALLAALLASGRAAAGPVPSTSTPEDKIAEIEKAVAALQKGQVDEAYKLLQEAAKKHPHLPPPRLMLARLFIKSDNRDIQAQGRGILERAAIENPDHPAVYYQLGALALGDGRLTEAMLCCQKALELMASDRWTADQKKFFQSECRPTLAIACERRGDWAGARAHLAALLELNPKDGQLRQRLATALFFLNKADEAYAELKEAYKNNPLLDPPKVTMGRLWVNKGDSPEAKKWFDQAVKDEPNSVKVRVAYADWLIQQGDINQAKIHLDTAAKNRVDDIDVLKGQGLIARLQKDLVAAKKYFHDAHNYAPGDFFAANQLALVLADQSNEDDRRKALQLAEVNARQYPNSAEALATLGYVNYRNGNKENALEALKRASSGGTVSADIVYFLALVLVDYNKDEEAAKFLKGAIDSKGVFVYRKEATALHEKLAKKLPAKDEKKEATKEK